MPRPDADAPAAGLPALWREALALLAYERGRAPSFAVALRRWAAGLAERGRRIRRVGRAVQRHVLAAEAACLRAGLALPRASADGGAAPPPWHLPDGYATLPADALPAHPLVDPARAASLARRSTAEPTALDAIAALLAPAAVRDTWRDRPRADAARPRADARIAVCLHLFYPELWPELHEQLRRLPERWDLIVTLPDFARTGWLDAIVADCPQARFAPRPNRGRDVLPWLHLLAQGAFDGYDAVCKLHGKKSPHTALGATWRQGSVGALVGDAANARALLAALRADPSIGMLGPAAHLKRPDADSWRAKSGRHLGRLARRGALPAEAAAAPFFAGTMFWFRPAALRPLRALGLRDADFEPEMAQTDGTLAHAVERFVGSAVVAAGYRIAAWDDAAGVAAPVAGRGGRDVPVDATTGADVPAAAGAGRIDRPFSERPVP